MDNIRFVAGDTASLPRLLLYGPYMLPEFGSDQKKFPGLKSWGRNVVFNYQVITASTAQQ